jgi:hypothetical protein
MDGLNISLLISEVCHKLDVNYQSPNNKALDTFKDAKDLAQLYLDLKIIIGKLQYIAEKHNIPELSNLLADDIEKLSIIDHDIVRMARRIKEDIEGEK